MRKFDFDLFTIGAGSGGVRASRLAAGFGARVAIAEESRLGGTCVNVGCIPKKLLAYAAHFSHDHKDSQRYGWSGEPRSFDWKVLIANKDAEIQRLNSVYADLLHAAGVDLVRGRAVVVDEHTVKVDGRFHTAENILVATGGRAQRPDIPGAHHAILSNQAFHLPGLPRRALVVGAGYIAVEFASIFNGLGSDVALVHRGDALLKSFDVDIGNFLAQEMARQGVQIRLGHVLTGIERVGPNLHCTFKNGRTEAFDCVLFATGRVPNTTGLGLREAGVELSPSGAIVVDESFRTAVPSIHAVGDCIDRIQLTPVALAEAMVVAHRLFNKGQRDVDYSLVPTAVFSDPNVATVGLGESRA